MHHNLITPFSGGELIAEQLIALEQILQDVAKFVGEQPGGKDTGAKVQEKAALPLGSVLQLQTCGG